MKISRRQVLGTLGTSIIATGANACGDAGQQQATAQTPLPAAPAATAPATSAGEFRIVFGGLQLYALKRDLSRVVIVMPHAAKNITPHRAQLGVLGGMIAANSTTGSSSLSTPFGISAHAFDLDGYHIKIDGGVAGTKLVVDDSAARTAKPGNADDWKSLRHIPDFALMHPHATLKTGWDTTLAQSVIDISAGELVALPGYDAPAGAGTVYQGQYFSHYSTLRLPHNGKIKLDLTALSASKQNAVIELEADSTGPMIAFLAFAPIKSAGVDHGASIEALFNNLSQNVHASSMTPKPPTAGQRVMPQIVIGPQSPSAQFMPLIDMLSDGTPSCPPYSFRF